MINLHDSFDGEQTLSQLWDSVYTLSEHVVNDNACSSEYPVEVRDMQLLSLSTLLDAIKRHHTNR